MRHPAFGLSLIVLFAGIIACDVFSAPAPTVDRIATSVSGTLTAQAEASAVAATVAALAKPTPFIPPTLPPGAPLVPTLPPGGTLVPTLPPGAPPVLTLPPVAPPVPTFPPSIYYNLVMRYSRNCLGVQGNQAVEATCSESTKVWNLPADPTAWNFQIQLQNTSNCLSASSTTLTDPFILKSCFGGGTQLWQKRPSGGYFQLANNTLIAAAPTTNMCVDARAWEQPIMQWFCKPWGDDNQLDNQLLCQTTSNTATCAPPAGVYVLNIQQTPPPWTDEGKPNTFHVYFNVTFSNSTGSAQSYRWFVQAFGQPGGQTEEKVLAIPAGTSTLSVGPWNIGRACTDYTAKAVWRRSDGLLFAFKDPDGREYSLSFRIQTGC